LLEHRSGQARQDAQLAEWRRIFDIINGPSDSENLDSQLKIDRQQLKEDVQNLSFPRYTSEARKAARKYISHRLAALGYGPQQHAFMDGVNVFADRDGTAPGGQHFIVAAHYDTVDGSPGADDNATGVAIVLEMARLFALTPAQKTIRFVFFDREEQGMQGSKAFAMDAHRLRGLQGVFVFEMLGTTCTSEECQNWPAKSPQWMRPNDGQFIAAIGMLEKTQLMRALVNARRPDSPPVLAIPVPAQGYEWPHSRRSDHAAFWDRNIDAVLVTDTGDFRNPRYHTSTDTPEFIDWSYLNGAAEIAHRAIRRMANL